MDAAHGVDYISRIVEINYPVVKPYDVDLVLSDKIPIPAAVVMAKSVSELKTKLSALDKGQVTEEYLRKIFHPLGGSLDRDFDARTVTATTVKSPNWEDGTLQGGYKIDIDPVTGRSTATFDKLLVRTEAHFNVLTIAELRSIGGTIILSAADAALIRVDYAGSYYRCYYKSGSGLQLWKVGDQARCQRFTGDGLKFYWRLVIAVSDKVNANGEHYIDLSKTIADGIGVPEVDDNIVLLGHRGVDYIRKNAIVISSGTLDTTEPYITQYKNIDSFSLDGKRKIHIGDNTEFKVKSFSIEGDDGNEYRVPRERGAWVDGLSAAYYDRFSLNGSLWLCIAPNGTTAEPSAAAEGVWLREVAAGQPGAAGDFVRPVFTWSIDKPAAPVGGSADVEPEGWSYSSAPVWILTDESGAVLTDGSADSSGAALTAAVDTDTYGLWMSQATFSGASSSAGKANGGAGEVGSGKDGAAGGELISEWSEPVLQSGQKGEPGKDVDPGTVDRLDKDIVTARTEAIMAFFGGVGDIDTIIKLLMGAGAPFEVKNNMVYITNAIIARLAVDEAFINSLKVMKLAAARGTIKLYNDRITIGDFDDPPQDQSNVLITYGNITSLASAGGSDANGSASNVSTTFFGNTYAAQPEQSFYITPNEIAVTVDNVNLQINTYINCNASSVQPSGSASIYVTLSLINASGAVIANIGDVSCSVFGMLSKSDIKTIATSVVVPAGVYRLRCDYVGNLVGGDMGQLRWAAALGSSTMSWDYKPNAPYTNVQVGVNGTAVVRNSQNLVHTCVDSNGVMHHVVKGETDMPGVLAKARVSNTGTISRKWGKDITAVQNITGQPYNKRISFENIVGEYSAVCTAFGGGAAPVVYNEAATYVDLYANGSFNIMLIGDNK